MIRLAVTGLEREMRGCLERGAKLGEALIDRIRRLEERVKRLEEGQRSVMTALLFRTIDAFRVFDLAFVMTQGGPADATTVLQLYGWRQMFAEGMVGYGAAVSVVVFLLALGVCLLYIGLFGSRLLRGAA